MRFRVFPILGLVVAGFSSCDRPAAGPTIGEKPKQIIDAAEATRAETEKKQEEQRQAIKAALGESATSVK
jgi:hypothetical protein